MNIARGIEEMRREVAEARAAGRTVGFVPTMGALHRGHFSLIDTARAAAEFVVVSIFVNPTQFGPGEDFQAYPRPTEQDLAACEEHNVDVAFVPTVEEMYAEGEPRTTVHVSQLTDMLCGRKRPGHFDGVCTVVAKLLNIVAPDKVLFGAKDYQQAAVIRRMVKDLNIPVEVLVCPTVREEDGLAISSRNAYLEPSQRKQAKALSESLQLARQLIADASPAPADVIEAMREYIAETAPDGEVDYIELVHPAELTPVEATDGPVLAAVAVKFGAARLIDHMRVDAGGVSS